jgi:hypothetical protein
MKRMAVAIFDLAKSIVVRPIKPLKDKPSNFHWTKFDKPVDQMTDVERTAAAERLADEMLGVIKNQKNNFA